ncbi:MAG TPA: hypothetical protein VK524_17205, partial [Polyangiaceae bacterium]|nr:hypothetical protein [Polyangiaceae bacterium]
MDLEQRLTNLERHHDWYGSVEALEQGIASAPDATVKAALHLRLGRLLHLRFLQGVKALKHFQDAFKLNPALLDALVEARGIYWELGKLNMVQKLLELQLKGTQDAAHASPLYRELGDVLCDQGEYERATEAYAKALQSSDGRAEEVSQLLQDVQVGDTDWQDRIGSLLRAGHEAGSSIEMSRAFLRAARIARRYAPNEFEAILAQAYGADPASVVTAALYESLLVEEERTETILDVQRQVLDRTSDPNIKADAAFRFGVRWALRHQNPEVGSRLLEEALRLDPGNEAAFTYLREAYGTRGGDWERVIRLADELADRANANASSAYLLANAGLAAWREQGDLIRARRFFERLALVDSEHPSLKAFELQIGQQVGQKGAEAPARRSERPHASNGSMPPPAMAALQSEYSDVSAEELQPAAARPAAAPTGRDAVIAELRERLAQQESAKRYHEYVKTLIQLGDELSDPEERTDLYLKAAELYVGKFANQAEAVKAYEKVLEADPTNPSALGYLRQMYEKRRDWEKLIQLSIGEASRMALGPERTQAYKEIAQLATERVKKPEVCVDLWAVVLENDPDDLDALNALSQLYERARDYDKLASVLEQLATLTYDDRQKIEILNKLGQVAGDRLKDDARAVEAYRTLLTLQPDDRRAQEQLKKRYVTLGRWDDLEVFYAETGKWDEFIRVLESNETRASDNEQRIGMLRKIAELWMTQKGKPDRAARAYEKILSLDENSLMAAERLIPLYAQSNNPKGLSGAIEVKLRHVEDADERLQLLREVAGLYEGRINDKPRAFERYLAAFQLAPGDERSQVDVERAAAQTGRWDDLVAAYRLAIDEAEQAGDRLSANALRLRLGRVLVEEVQHVDQALIEYRAVYESEPDNTVALEALEHLYRQTERWRELLEVYGRKRELVEDSQQKKVILYEIAKLYEEQIG